MPNYEFYSESFYNEKARDEISFKLKLKEDVRLLKNIIEQEEQSIRMSSDNDITTLKIHDIQILYKKLKRAENFLKKFEENSLKKKDEKIPFERFVYLYNDGNYRSRVEAVMTSKEGLKIQKLRDRGITIGTIVIWVAILLCFCSELFSFVVILMPIAFVLNIFLVLIFNAIRDDWVYEKVGQYPPDDYITEAAKISVPVFGINCIRVVKHALKPSKKIKV